LFDKLLKGKFRKLEITPVDISCDLTKDCIPKLANNYGAISKSDILLIYNVMNEITTIHSSMVWKNIRFILNNVERPLLILLAEPSAPNASPRINWLKIQLAQCSDVIHSRDEERFFFDAEPLKIDFENTGIGLNDRLFGQTMDGSKPQLMTDIDRSHMTCRIYPQTPISIEQVQKQLAMLNIKRGKKGRFIKQSIPQSTFWEIDPDWGK
jgi:hypothetical protein